MAAKKPYTFTIKLQSPPKQKPCYRKLIYPTPDNPRPTTNPAIFNDALVVRHKVFVQEQGCSAEGEIDDDDPRSWQWVVYASSSSPRPAVTENEIEIENAREGKEEEEAEAIPVAVIRLVPPPHPPHEMTLQEHHPEERENTKTPPPKSTYDWDHEPYVKITRLAVLPEFRGYGLSRWLLTVAEEWAVANAGVVNRVLLDEFVTSTTTTTATTSTGTGMMQMAAESMMTWKGLVILHAQVQVEKMYERLGYEVDRSLGVWDEEGIDHVGMFQYLDVRPSGSGA